ncbi:solute carrier organic anion transporter family member 3A1 [Nomia melanderi]|uniref:solute carrier organic anion transporter family member 3A1 n=1 Tax=Nomia melanderi TaxID=2448451 RepID=UPI0013045FA4|nr:solute carrier organic anion transporter family member 3A1-like [Nomia melanderi]
MTIRLQEVMRSEVEGGLSGPANPIPSESIDCGCAQLPCPKLAKFATRRLFVGLLSWVGIVQAAAYAYFHVVGPTIARRFQIDPYVMEWILAIPDLIPLVFGLIIAYWGDRIHRVAWVGAIVLLQSISYFIMIIPHLTHQIKIIDEPDNATHMSLYSDDNRDLCSPTKMIAKEEEMCYFSIAVLVVIQVLIGIANISYFALAISYLDDNTKKKHIAGFIGVVIAVKILGVLLGFVLSWVCLGLDAVKLSPIESYREQIGAWWLGLPILTILLIVPGLLLSWFPRMLPSQVVARAAASLLNINSGRSNRVPRRLISEKTANPSFLSSMARLFTNKILICIVLAYTLYMMATLNFMSYENLIIQARFYVPKPTGTLLGFNDPVTSRLITNILKPVLIGLIIVVSGLVITKAKPSSRSILEYGVIVTIVSAGIIFTLTVTSCEKRPIVGSDGKGSLFLLRYCNRNCGCSNDADFHPVCDSKGKFTFYSPCHAGCTSSEQKNGMTIYTGCSCMEDTENKDLYDGPCDSKNCQFGWLIFELSTLLVYILIASMVVGDFLIVLRSVYPQDKAVSIAFWMMWSALIINICGKLIYDTVANLTCQYWGSQKTACRLHESLKLGNYLCYLTGSILVLSIVLKVLLWFFCKNLQLYVQESKEVSSGAEMQQLMTSPTKRQPEPSSRNNNNNTVQAEVSAEEVPNPVEPSSQSAQREEEQKQNEPVPLKYGPLGPGNRRTGSKSSLSQASQSRQSDIRNLDSEDELSSTDDDGKKDSSPKVAYKPLDLDSDVESDLGSAEPRSRRRILSKDYDRVYNSDQPSSAMSSLPRREFPNPANYDDPRLSRRLQPMDQNGYIDGSRKTNSFEYSKKGQEKDAQKKGDFNEVGIPIVESYPSSMNTSSPFARDVKALIDQYEHNSDHTNDQGSVKSGDSGHRPEYRVVAGVPLIAMASRSSRGPSSLGYSSLTDGKHLDERPDSRESNSPKTASSKGSRGTLHTDF